jgi:hypothetical protein
MHRLAYLVIAVAATGCTLHFGDDTGDDGCPLNTRGNDQAVPIQQQLNPETLQCEAYYGNTCDPRCGPCDTTGQDARPAPTWAYCGDACEALGETDCLLATACRATYDYACFTGRGPCTALTPFLGCYGTDQNGPIQGACTGLGAQQCSEHNDCIALHSPQCSGDTAECWEQFIECRGEGVFCYEPVVCDIPPPPCTDDSVPAVRDGCYTGDCIPLDQCEPVCDTTDCG